MGSMCEAICRQCGYKKSYFEGCGMEEYYSGKIVQEFIRREQTLRRKLAKGSFGKNIDEYYRKHLADEWRYNYHSDGKVAYYCLKCETIRMREEETITYYYPDSESEENYCEGKVDYLDLPLFCSKCKSKLVRAFEIKSL